MNFNTSLYSNALTGISEEFNVSAQAARCGAMIFLVAYAFGCELWAPWSEELGRKPILQASLFLVNLWQLPVALAPNFASIMVGRFLGGLSSAGGSVTLGMIADMWDADHQQYAVAYVVFSSVGGSALGPVVGGMIVYVSFYNPVLIILQVSLKSSSTGDGICGSSSSLEVLFNLSISSSFQRLDPLS
jgi:MFS family permease